MRIISGNNILNGDKVAFAQSSPTIVAPTVTIPPTEPIKATKPATVPTVAPTEAETVTPTEALIHKDNGGISPTVFIITIIVVAVVAAGGMFFILKKKNQ